MPMHGGWVLELDIEAFFDSIDKAKLRGMLCKRVRDGVLIRLIGKWLNAGVMEEGVVYHPEAGYCSGKRDVAGWFRLPRGAGRRAAPSLGC
jgi:retron-type reverse transcriptase